VIVFSEDKSCDLRSTCGIKIIEAIRCWWFEKVDELLNIK